jgi:hypothetical protein
VLYRLDGRPLLTAGNTIKKNTNDASLNKISVYLDGWARMNVKYAKAPFQNETVLEMIMHVAKEMGSLPGLIEYCNNIMINSDSTGGTEDEALLLMTRFLKKLETPESTVLSLFEAHYVLSNIAPQSMEYSFCSFCLTGNSQKITSTLTRSGCYGIWNFLNNGRTTVRVIVMLIENGLNASSQHRLTAIYKFKFLDSWVIQDRYCH